MALFITPGEGDPRCRLARYSAKPLGGRRQQVFWSADSAQSGTANVHRGVSARSVGERYDGDRHFWSLVGTYSSRPSERPGRERVPTTAAAAASPPDGKLFRGRIRASCRVLARPGYRTV